MQWKRRLYAFFLRRIVGPYLTSSSRAQLMHESVEIEVTEGKYILRDVEFDMDYLHSLLSQSITQDYSKWNFRCQHISVQKLEILLALVEENDPFHPNTSATTQSTDITDDYYSSFGKTVGTAAAVMRKIYKLRSSTSVDTSLQTSNNISLVVHVILDGIDIHVMNMNSRVFQDVRKDTKSSSTPTYTDSMTQDQGLKSRASSFVASYIEAALNSLQLNIELSNVHVRLSSSPDHQSEQNSDRYSDTSIIMLFHALSYKETPTQNQYDLSYNASTMGINKNIQISPFQIDLNYIQDGLNRKDKLLVYTGNSSVKYTSIYFDDESNQSSDRRAILEHSWDISLDQPLELCLHLNTLGHLSFLFPTVSKSEELQSFEKEPTIKYNGPKEQDDDDENDAGLLALVLKQREEALHRASTREVRGGILIPSLEQGGSNMNVIYDTFFDANEYSYSQHRNFRKSLLIKDSSKDPRKLIKTSAHIAGLIIRWDFKADVAHRDWQTAHACDEAILVSIRELSIESSFSSEHFVNRVDIAEFDVTELWNGRFYNIFHFEKRFSNYNEDDANNVIDAISFPLSVQIIRETVDSTSSMKIIGSLAPLAMCLRTSTISKIQRLYSALNNSERDKASEGPSVLTCCIFTCARVTIDIPLTSTDALNVQEEIDNKFIHRHALYSNSSATLYDDECSLQLSIDNMHFSYDSCPYPPTGDDIIPSIHAKLTSLRSIVGLSLPYRQKNGREARLALDLIILDSDVLHDSKSIVMLEYTVMNQLSNPSNASRRKWSKKYFPWITPLATVKATQNHDVKPLSRGARGSDPQAMLFSDACECDRNAFLYIHHIIIDISRSELIFLAKLSSSQNYFNAANGGDAMMNGSPKSDTAISSDSISYGLRCDLVTITSYIDNMSSGRYGCTTESNYAYILAMDRCSLHALNQSVPRKFNMRFTLHDFSLFEARADPIQNQSRSDDDALFLALNNNNFCLERCKRARERRVKVKGTPLIFRTKICQPLSPRTPAIILDILKRFDDGDVPDEQSFYFSLYDSTFRCASLNLDWASRLSSLIDLGTQTDNKPFIESVEIPSKDDRGAIIKFFVTISDCGIDYISPDNFRTGASIKLRVGEVRLTSIILKPPASAQNIQVSVSDIILYLSNDRISHKQENYDVLGSNLFCHGGRGQDPWLIISFKSFEEAMSKMNFIAIVNVDSLGIIVSLVSSSSELQQTPSTISLSIGRVSLYACRDSLRCFSDTVGELSLFLTSPQPRQNLEKFDSKPQMKKRSISMKDAIADALFSKTEGGNSTVDSVGFKNQQDNFKLVDMNMSASSTQNPFTYPSDVFYALQSDRSWTTIDYLSDRLPQGIEQVSRWYDNQELCANTGYDNQELCANTVLPEDATVIVDAESDHREIFKLFPQHIPHTTSSKTMLGAQAFMADSAGTVHLAIKVKFAITDMTLVCRFFDGYDWPQRPKSASRSKAAADVKSIILEELMNDNANVSDGLHFECPTRMINVRSDEPFDCVTWKRRQIEKFFQFQMTGLKTLIDLFEKSSEHRLCSFMNISLTDFVLADRLSSQRPLKVLGEWYSDKEHPRDSNDGLLMITMVTMNPREKISSDKRLMSDEAQVVLEILPMRCFLHQSSLKFMKDFFSYSDTSLTSQLNIEPPPPTFFQSFKVKPVKLKIDYVPDFIDIAALKNGNLIELLNLLPIEEMVLRLNPLEIRNSSGWSSIFTEIINRWLENITTNQMHKFITRTSPIQPISSVGEGVKELIMIPIDEYRQGGDVSTGLCKGASDLASIIAYETAKFTGRLTRIAAKTLDRSTKENSNDTLWSEGNGVNNTGVTVQALESLTRGVKEANAKVVIIPYREYQRCGPKGAMKSVIKGLPIAICAPLSGAAEALSLGLQGFCDHIRPDQKNETEAFTD